MCDYLNNQTFYIIMKKSIILICALAVAGLFASCQKENVVTPEQNAEQDVVTVDLQGIKGETDLEPLVALSQVLQNGDSAKGDIAVLVRNLLREFFRTIGNLIGADEEKPIHTLQYFGDWKAFGHAVDQIRQFSYNASSAVEPPFIQIQLGNAEEYKIGGLEVMPVSNFQLGLGKGYRSVIQVMDALCVRFTFEKKGYMFIIYSGEGNRLVRATQSNGAAFGFKFGRCSKVGEAMIFDYNKMIEKMMMDSESKIISPAEMLMTFIKASGFNSTASLDVRIGLDFAGLEIDFPDTYFEIISTNTSKYLEIDAETFYLEYDAVKSEGVEVEFESYMDHVYAELEGGYDEGNEFARDFLKAQIFGCNESEANALSQEYETAFPDNDLIVYGYGYADTAKVTRCWGYYTGAHLSLGSEAVSGMKFKPAFGLYSLNAVLEREFYSFSRIDRLYENNPEAYYAFWEGFYDLKEYANFNQGEPI